MIAEIKMKSGQTIKLRLYPQLAPITVDNFVSLANSGFYDGLIFHRVIKDFMIQGGDPTGTGCSGSGKTIKGEFAANGYEGNNLSHERGIISMARNNISMDSASSQFFIVHQSSPFLDGLYAAFGSVAEGIEVVDSIATVPTDPGDRPVLEQVIETIRVTEE